MSKAPDDFMAVLYIISLHIGIGEIQMGWGSFTDLAKAMIVLAGWTISVDDAVKMLESILTQARIDLR